jgi:response regulator RpfG family c-di-GMP phosphodiesterase
MIHTGIEQYQLVTAEKELLENTLHGSVKVLTDILAIVNPIAFGRASRVTRYVREIVDILTTSPDSEDSEQIKYESGATESAGQWEFELAAMLSQIGCVTIPADALERMYKNETPNEDISRQFAEHPEVGGSLIANIPRLGGVAEMIKRQENRFDGSGSPNESLSGSMIPLGSRILKVVLDYDLLRSLGTAQSEVLQQMHERSGWYDPTILAALEISLGHEAEFRVERVRVSDLKLSMVLAEDVISTDGRLLIAKGHELSESIVRHLQSRARNEGVREPIQVLVPVPKEISGEEDLTEAEPMEMTR